jgi:hypothetical protein
MIYLQWLLKYTVNFRKIEICGWLKMASIKQAVVAFDPFRISAKT